jgi:CRP-like cAMP-binding protein
VVPLEDGRDTRLAGLRRGATIGEMGFFDRAPRSATVVAQEDVEIAVLTRGAYEDLSQQHPHLMQQLLSNVMLDLAARLRHTNRVAVARNTQA